MVQGSDLVRIEDLTRRELMASALGAALLIACGDGDDELATTQTPEPTTRSFEDAFGAQELPLPPERVIAINAITFEGALLAGEHAVVAVGRTAIARPLYKSLVEEHGIQVIETFETDLEQVALLEPDLILDGATEGGVFSGADPADLRRLAPLAAFPFENDYGWKDYYTFFADAVNQKQAALAELERYNQRIERLRGRIGGSDAVAKISVSSIRVRDGASVDSYNSTTFSARILDDIGFNKPGVSQDFSLERIREADADYVFVWQFNVEANDFQSNLENPLWQQLEAVKNDRVLNVETHWLGSGPAAAHRVLDDLDAALGVDSRS